MYSVKEIFYTLQGEGAHAGRPAIFCRFTGCNLWSGREQDRATAVCDFCDTDFIGTDGQNGGKFATAESLVQRLRQFWPPGASTPPYLVCTGGEPALQLDQTLVDALHAEGFIIAIETNGSKPLPEGIDWICVSPKADTPLCITQGNELKLVYPQILAQPERFEALAFEHFYLQPLDGPDATAALTACLHYCLQHPQWKLSLQTHKMIGID
ncbi:MAG: 7-carboxy-7-deazaguanine synthase [Nitrincola lacisaponensis]|uniref:7-carboxy-7-deazaguanine synthase n=1 Tax=Nitrincola lacisaponensis TaxID=267850 RepID=A0A063Y1A0_9GAMM|nr:7-carboxy-7-deazaguanine synthase [Nitrincola lacisaponensis]KDE38536.1 Queuosine Biosynthesis QueE Radical SAM [Nitrincola lacisaponensis]